MQLKRTFTGPGRGNTPPSLADKLKHMVPAVIVRCSPDCPYEDCIINIIEPPFQQEGPGEGEKQDASGNNSGNGNMDKQSSGDTGDGQGQPQDQPAQGESQSSSSVGSSGSGGGHGGQSENSDGKSDNSPADTQSTPDNSQGNSGPQQPDMGKSDSETSPESNQAGRGVSDRPESQAPQQQRREVEAGQPEQPQEKKQEYQPVFAEKKPGRGLPDGYTNPGGGAGLGDDIIEDLGKHRKREEVPSDVTFQTRLRNVMTDNSYDRQVKGRKRGKLDMKSLYKVPMKAENVFTLKEARKNKNYNVILLIDQSGSMYASVRSYTRDEQRKHDEIANEYHAGRISIKTAQQQIGDIQANGRNIDVAAESATFLMRSLDKVGVDYAVIGYSGSPKLHKKFEQGANDDQVKKLAFDLKHTGGGGTRMMPALVMGFELLKKTRNQGKNIVICLSDGDPGENHETIQHFIKGHEKTADFVDIGINNRPVTENGFKITNLDDLKPALLRELKARIKRG